MRRFKSRWLLSAGMMAVTLAGGGLTSGAAASPANHAHPSSLPADAPVTVVAQGLNNPRDLTWGPYGHLLVSEAGTVGTECPADCFSTTGSIADISSGTPVRIVQGLANATDAGNVVGADSLVYRNGHLYTLVAKSSNIIPASGLSTALSDQLHAQLGTLLDVTNPWRFSAIAKVGDFDWDWGTANKNHSDADPNDFAPGPNGSFYVVDAASNTLDSVDSSGHVKVLAWIPPAPVGDSVPSCVDTAPDGAVYLSELTGVGNSATAANVYKYVPGTGALTVWQTGFSAVTGCGFGANGDFYVTEFDNSGFPPSAPPVGAVVQIAPNGTRTVLGGDQLHFPTGFLAGSDGSVYVADNAISSGDGTPSGRVVKIG